MQTDTKEKITRERMIRLFDENHKAIFINDTPAISGLRKKAIETFGQLGFPNNQMEAWRGTDLKESLEKGSLFHLLKKFSLTVTKKS